MRSRTFYWGILSLVILTVLGTCRQLTAPKATTPDPANQDAAGVPATQRAPKPTTWPGLSAAPVASPATPTQSAAKPEGTAAQVALITAQDPDSEVTVRSQPSVEADPLGYARVGEIVTLQQEETAENGNTWRYVSFQDTKTTGWIHADYLDVQLAPTAESGKAPTPPTGDAALKIALDDECGAGKAVEASFMTQNYSIYICKVRGQHLYLSQEKGTEQVIKADEVEVSGESYFVTNGDYEYRLDADSFVVVRIDDGKQEEVLREAIVHTERY